VARDDLLFVETDDSCALCGLKDTRALTIHHLEQSEPKNENYDNKLVLCHNCHHCFHQGKGVTAEDLKNIKRRLIIKTLTLPGINAMKCAYRREGVVAMPFLVNHLVELGYLRQGDAIRFDTTDAGVEVITDAMYLVTEEGRTLLEKWELK
jgi:hypothetical protein